ncbi:T6SS phospholipase effector Tle1-like catalytic domain-containing protein [Frateuria defendens]|uniref:phospholipase effector Tle1 domain-containing protein n=1 Tax=Frateuria defendens TaxID=2219559 RepID=UPI000AC0ADD3
MSDEKHKLGKDGVLEDGVSYYSADARRLQTYQEAGCDLAQFQAPVLIHADNPHERLYVAAFDGTGNDVHKDPEHATNVARIDAQIQSLNATGHTQVKAGYVPGPGTQDNFLERVWDGVRGSTYDARLEQMYGYFVEQVKEWKAEDPSAEIRVASIGFSRGADQVAGFARRLHERGIVDPDSRVTRVDEHGHQVTEYTRYIVPPGQVPQVEGLFDPVGTGVPLKHDRRPPPSVISGFQIIAEDERRAKFKSDHIIDPGLSPGGRFLGVTVAGAHSDIGGSYHRDGLALRSENLMVDYLNALSDRPFLQRSVHADVTLCEGGRLCANVDAKGRRFGERRQYLPVVPR